VGQHAGRVGQHHRNLYNYQLAKNEKLFPTSDISQQATSGLAIWWLDGSAMNNFANSISNSGWTSNAEL